MEFGVVGTPSRAVGTAGKSDPAASTEGAQGKADNNPRDAATMNVNRRAGQRLRVETDSDASSIFL
jgi:hypothetical protein